MNPSFRTLLVGVDLSDAAAPSAGSRRALEQARWVADATGARLVLVHSSRPDAGGDASRAACADAPTPDADARRRALENEVAALRGSGIAAEFELSDEPAWLAVVQRALRENAELAIVGKRTATASDGRLLGSVAHKLLRTCPGAVWVVKPDAASCPESVLAATDLSPVGDRAVALAAWISDRCGAALHVVHALELPLSIQMEGEASSEAYLAERRADAVEEIRARIPEAQRAAAELHVALTSPSNAILAAAERFDCDLVVMGTVSRSGIAGLAVGNTAERMLARLDRSLLTVKPDDFASPVKID